MWPSSWKRRSFESTTRVPEVKIGSRGIHPELHAQRPPSRRHCASLRAQLLFAEEFDGAVANHRELSRYFVARSPNSCSLPRAPDPSVLGDDRIDAPISRVVRDLREPLERVADSDEPRSSRRPVETPGRSGRLRDPGASRSGRMRRPGSEHDVARGSALRAPAPTGSRNAESSRARARPSPPRDPGDRSALESRARAARSTASRSASNSARVGISPSSAA